MPSIDDPTTAAATILTTRRNSGAPGPRLPETCRPASIEAALAIQAQVIMQSGQRIGGWKCGMPVADGVVLGPIPENAIFITPPGGDAGPSPCPARSKAGMMRIEPELAFIIGRDLPPRDTPYANAEIDSATARTHLALELIDSRYHDPASVPFLEHLADGLLNHGLLLGPPVDDAVARETVLLPIGVTVGTEPERLLDGRHPAGDPRAPLYWLAEFLRSRGQGLRAGQAVITGSYVASFEVPAGSDLHIRFGGLGMLAARFGLE